MTIARWADQPRQISTHRLLALTSAAIIGGWLFRLSGLAGQDKLTAVFSEQN
jgi:hypothetical protein